MNERSNDNDITAHRRHPNNDANRRMVGVTVFPEYLQSEGVDAVLDNLQGRAGVNAVTTSPYVMAPADAQSGVREPPIDAGAGSVRLLDRPLWGHRELWVRTAPSFEPDRSLYKGLKYQPAEPNELTRTDGDVIDRFIQAAQDRGMKVYFQVQAAIPPGYRVQFGGPDEEDAPRLPNGEIPRRRVANNASLASSHLIAYQCALIRDLCRRYPKLDGIRFDWPEYPPYSVDDWFVDFSEPARKAAGELGFDFELMRRDAATAYRRIHGGLGDDLLGALSDSGGDGGRFVLLQSLMELPGLLELARFKGQLSTNLLKGFRRTMDESGAKMMEMVPNAFPPPWSLISGLDFGAAAPFCSAFSVKLYTMHWSMMMRSYIDQLFEANPHVDESMLVRAVVRLFDLLDGEAPAERSGWRYPEPDEPHRAGREAQSRKIRQAQWFAGSTPVYALAHGYGPVDDFRQRLEAARDASLHGVWLNRYGYLSNAKLDAVGEAMHL